MFTRSMYLLILWVGYTKRDSRCVHTLDQTTLNHVYFICSVHCMARKYIYCANETTVKDFMLNTTTYATRFEERCIVNTSNFSTLDTPRIHSRCETCKACQTMIPLSSLKTWNLYNGNEQNQMCKLYTFPKSSHNNYYGVFCQFSAYIPVCCKWSWNIQEILRHMVKPKCHLKIQEWEPSQ